MTLRKVLVPFADRYGRLGTHWWHRLAVVVFFAAVPITLFTVWFGANGQEMKQYETCLQLNLAVQQPIEKGCAVFLPHSRDNFILGLIAAVACSYLLQLAYYRVMLYVALGAPRADSKV